MQKFEAQKFCQTLTKSCRNLSKFAGVETHGQPRGQQPTDSGGPAQYALNLLATAFSLWPPSVMLKFRMPAKYGRNRMQKMCGQNNRAVKLVGKKSSSCAARRTISRERSSRKNPDTFTDSRNMRSRRSKSEAQSISNSSR